MIRSEKERKVNYYTTYRKVSAKKTMRTVNVKGESVVKGGKCTTEKMSPRPHTVTTTDGVQVFNSMVTGVHADAKSGACQVSVILLCGSGVSCCRNGG